MNKNRLTKLIVYFWTILTFLVDLFVMVTQSVDSVLMGSVMIIELLTSWVAYQVCIEKRWALIVLTVYYALRSFNLYLDTVSFYSKSGLNIEISITNLIGVNIPTVLFFFLLLKELRKKPRLPKKI